MIRRLSRANLPLLSVDLAKPLVVVEMDLIVGVSDALNWYLKYSVWHSLMFLY